MLESRAKLAFSLNGNMNIKLPRIFIRVSLTIVLLVSVIVVVLSVNVLDSKDKEPWAVIAAALAVITSVVSAWNAQRLLEIQQDALLPNPIPSIDVTSRYGLLQLRVTNLGGLSAHNIRLSWNEPLTNSKDELVVIGADQNDPHIPVLLPKDSISTLIDGHVQFFGKFKDANYKGIISYEDAAGNKYNKQFSLSAEMYRNTLLHPMEEPKTHFELQKIPKEIENLTKAIKDLKR